MRIPSFIRRKKCSVKTCIRAHYQPPHMGMWWTWWPWHATIYGHVGRLGRRGRGQDQEEQAASSREHQSVLPLVEVRTRRLLPYTVITW